jgi:hypothetical protein
MRWTCIAAAATVAAVVLSACGSGGGSSPTSPTAGAPPAAQAKAPSKPDRHRSERHAKSKEGVPTESHSPARPPERSKPDEDNGPVERSKPHKAKGPVEARSTRETHPTLERLVDSGKRGGYGDARDAEVSHQPAEVLHHLEQEAREIPRAPDSKEDQVEQILGGLAGGG